MPKYILDIDGNIKDLSNGNEDVPAINIAKKYVGHGESVNLVNLSNTTDNVITDNEFTKTFFNLANVNLPIGDLLSDDVGFQSLNKHTITETSPPDLQDGFVKRDRDNPKKNFLLNPSFGADNPQTFYNNFSDYLNKGDIFATELEIAAGADFNSAGLRDITRLVFWLDYLVENIVYIAIVEALLGTENLLGSDEGAYTAQSSNGELGNYGPKNYTAITKYFREVLNYPSQSKESVGLNDRIGAFFIGLALFVNADDSSNFLKGYLKEASFGARTTTAGANLVQDLLYYLADSLFSLSNIGNNRLLMLIRRFHQKGDWHQNQIYKAKSLDKTKENIVEKYLVHLNHYYFKFLVERMHVGLKTVQYYRDKDSRIKKFHRSGRLKDSRNKAFGFSAFNNYTIYRDKYPDYFALNSETLKFGKLDTAELLSEKQALYGDNVGQQVYDAYNDKLSRRQSMSNALLPQALIYPDSLIRSNTVKKHSRYQAGEALCEDIVRGYFLRTTKPQERISQKAVKQIEDYYEKEMMPFYIQDVRTNEILGFHAFIDSITDNFNVNHNATKGFGRIEDVRHYVDTTRNVNITFTLAAMSKEDHDLMWYQINKVVAMCYPQWSRGFKNQEKDPEGLKGFEYPFTQVPTASPLIRIRLGDVLKSNYSKHSLKKIHGAGNGKQDTFWGGQGSIYVKDKTQQIRILPGVYRNKKTGEYKEHEEVVLVDDSNNSNSNNSKGTYNSLDGLYRFFHNKKNSHLEKVSNSFSNMRPKPGNRFMSFFFGDDEYEVDNKSLVFENPNYNDVNDPQKSNNKKNKLLISDYEEYVNAYDSDREKINNPITAAYESTLGRGLAGFITMLDVNYQDQLWETEVVGSKAPKLVKLTINFAPTHDIAPGLDADGAMRAPVYNTGRIVNTIYGDVYDNSTMSPKNTGYPNEHSNGT